LKASLTNNHTYDSHFDQRKNEWRDTFLCPVGDENPIRCLGNYCEDLEKYEWVRQMLLAFYLIVSNILLLNMLIAVFT
jgi:hypothetical protein